MRNRVLQVCALVSVLFLAVCPADGQSVPSAITYQGKLTDSSGVPVPGPVDLTFKLYEADVGGTAFWTKTVNGVAVSAGVFTVQLGPLGPAELSRAQVWLETQVGADPPLPRVRLLSVPYAINNWSLTGNAGTDPAVNFLGTTDSQAFEIKVNGLRALRIEPVGNSESHPTANIVAGCDHNRVIAGAIGATVSGGGGGQYGAPQYVYPNEVTDDFGTVAGGMGNHAGDYFPESYNCWGDSSPQSAPYATVGGGLGNHAVAESATVGGGQDNSAGSMDCDVQRSIGKHATVAGGVYNHARATASSVGGGRANAAGGFDSFTEEEYGQYSAIGGGYGNSTLGDWTTVGGGYGNSAGSVGAYGYYKGDGAAVAGGIDNQANGYCSFVGGGYGNEVGLACSVSDTGGYSVVAGGHENEASGHYSAIGGGLHNTAAGWYAAVPGGAECAAKGWWSLAAGRRAKVAEEYHTGTFIWADSTDADFTSTGEKQFLIRAGGGVGINTNAPAEKLHVASGNALVGGPTNFAADGDEARLNLGDGNNYVRAVRGTGVMLGAYEAADGLALANGGKVGIGTTSPSEKLQVDSGNFLVRGPDNFWIDGHEAYLFVGDNNTYVKAVRGSGLRLGAYMAQDGLVLVDGGNVGVGTTTPSEKLHVAGNVTADAYLTNSDSRFKKNVKPLVGALDSVANLRPVRFDWKREEFPSRHFGGDGQVGLIAQEVRDILPEVVTQGSDGYYQIDYARLTPVLVQAIKEQQVRIERAEQDNASLRQELGELKKLVSSLVNGR